MRLRKIPGALEFVTQHDDVLNEIQAAGYVGKWNTLFGAEQPLYLEIGMGRGRFIITSARQNPNINYLGLELREEIIMQAIERMPAALPNLRFLHMNAAALPELFGKEEVDRIYLHFSDPWPKARHAKRRLTAMPFLEQYLQILKPQGELYFKTDNADLFVWSVENIVAAGFVLLEREDNLPEERTGIQTEYESRFRKKGVPIHFLRARKA